MRVSRRDRRSRTPWASLGQLLFRRTTAAPGPAAPGRAADAGSAGGAVPPGPPASATQRPGHPPGAEIPGGRRPHGARASRAGGAEAVKGADREPLRHLQELVHQVFLVQAPEGPCWPVHGWPLHAGEDCRPDRFCSKKTCITRSRNSPAALRVKVRMRISRVTPTPRPGG